MSRRPRPKRSVLPALLVVALALAVALGGWYAATGGGVPGVQPGIVGTWVSDDGVAVRFDSDGTVHEGVWTHDGPEFDEPYAYVHRDGGWFYGENWPREIRREGDALRYQGRGRQTILRRR